MLNFNLSFKSKKGNAIIDGLYVVIGLFVIGFLILGGRNLSTDMNEMIQDDDDISVENKVVMQGHTDNYPKIFDSMFMFFLMFFWILAVVFSFFIDVNPIFLIFSIILIIVVLLVALNLSNSFVETATDGTFENASSDFPMMMFVMEYFLQFILAIIFSIALALYAKSRSD